MSNWKVYKNGNYIVSLNILNGTKIRGNDLDFFAPTMPESMDIKITNQCDMDCPYCFVAGTKILMEDLTYKNIEDVIIGDIVIGFEEKANKPGVKRKIIKSEVKNIFSHIESELLSVTTSSGNNIIATPNHPFLSEGTMKNHSRIFNQIGRIKEGSNIFECGFPIDVVNYNSDEYKRGYMISSWAGDGCFQHYIDKNGYDAYISRFVTKDEEINDMVYQCSVHFIPYLYRLDFNMASNGVCSSVRSNKRDTYNYLVSEENKHIGINNTKEYYCGFLAGFCDSEGHVDNQRSIIRLFNTDIRYINEVTRCLDGLNITYVIEERHNYNTNKKYKDCYVVRITGQYSVSKFLWYTRTVCRRKSLDNYQSKQFQYYKHQIIKKESINQMQLVYNFETDCHTYIANNFLVHNCHENSTPDGKHGDIMNAKFIETLHPYTELAIGGGNPLAHPDLVQFLKKCKELKLVPSMTINQKHFLECYDFVKSLVEQKLIYGLGVSLTGVGNDLVSKLKEFPNAVIHVINGVTPIDELKQLYGHNLKMLILGYKVFRRGEQYYSDAVEKVKSDLYKELPTIINQFKVVSFDNLAIKQLDVERILSKEKWDEFYMGDDGQFTMYIDMVNHEFATNSTATVRWPMMDDIKPMFEAVMTHKLKEDAN